MDRIEALGAFVRVVETGSFSDVAGEKGVSQPTISKWVQSLEEEFGATLLDRTTRVHRVTETGRLAYDQAKELLARFELMAQEIAQEQTTLSGRIRLSVPVVFGRRILVPLLSQFLHKHPEVELDLDFTDRYVNLLEEGYDGAVRVGIPADSSLRAVQLGSTDRHLVASPDYVKNHPRLRTPDDLRKHSCLVLRGSDAAWSFTRRDKRMKKRVRPQADSRIRLNNSDAALTLALEGHGFALLASWLVADDLARGGLKEALSGWQAPRAPIHLLLPPGRFTGVRMRALIDELKLGLNAETDSRDERP